MTWTMVGMQVHVGRPSLTWDHVEVLVDAVIDLGGDELHLWERPAELVDALGR